MPRPRIVILVIGLVGALTMSGCANDDPARTPTPAPTSTSITSLDTAGMRLVRVAYCDLVPAPAVELALGGTATSGRSWGNGQAIPVVKGHDVAHEFGCTWSGPRKRTAQTWVFARAVSNTYAAKLVRASARAPGCENREGPAFGSPSLTQVCTVGGTTRIRHAGLFGDTWLTCQVSGKSSTSYDVRRRTDAWCVSVAQALDTGR